MITIDKLKDFCQEAETFYNEEVLIKEKIIKRDNSKFVLKLIITYIDNSYYVNVYEFLLDKHRKINELNYNKSTICTFKTLSEDNSEEILKHINNI